MKMTIEEVVASLKVEIEFHRCEYDKAVKEYKEYLFKSPNLNASRWGMCQYHNGILSELSWFLEKIEGNPPCPHCGREMP